VDLDKVERDFLAFAYLASEHGSQPFCPCGLCDWLRISRADCAGVLRRLELLGLFHAMPDDLATLTSAGLDVAAKIMTGPAH
jgi:hypothetical protein